MLHQWAAGHFEADWTAHPLDGIEGKAAPSLPAAIDRAALDACAGGILPADPERDDSGLAFLSRDLFRLDPDRLKAGAVTRSMPCPWQAGFLRNPLGWPAALAPEQIMTGETYRDLQALDAEIADLPTEDSAAERL